MSSNKFEIEFLAYITHASDSNGLRYVI
jgi:hypothetical protein